MNMQKHKGQSQKKKQQKHQMIQINKLYVQKHYNINQRFLSKRYNLQQKGNIQPNIQQPQQKHLQYKNQMQQLKNNLYRLHFINNILVSNLQLLEQYKLMIQLNMEYIILHMVNYIQFNKLMRLRKMNKLKLLLHTELKQYNLVH